VPGSGIRWSLQQDLWRLIRRERSRGACTADFHVGVAGRRRRVDRTPAQCQWCAGLPQNRARLEKRLADGHELRWHATVVRQLLRDRCVLGYLQPCVRVDGKRVKEGNEVKGYPAIVDAALWARVQSVLRQRPDQTRAGRKDRRQVNLVQAWSLQLADQDRNKYSQKKSTRLEKANS
jgi:hypothetical protein